MKRRILILFAVASLGLSSCQEELLYSCNEELNGYVAENLEEIHLLNRAEWKDLDLELRIPVYRAFTQEQKQTFWIQKVEETMELNWNSEEMAHLQKLLDYFQCNPQIFADDFIENEEEFCEFDKFQYEWCAYAETELGWSKNLTYSIIADGNRIKDKNGTLDISVEQWRKYLRRAEGAIPNCNCSTYDNNCEHYCSQNYACNVRQGCGAAWNFWCNGLCQ